jgi:hypothetical protein
VTSCHEEGEEAQITGQVITRTENSVIVGRKEISKERTVSKRECVCVRACVGACVNRTENSVIVGRKEISKERTVSERKRKEEEADANP